MYWVKNGQFSRAYYPLTHWLWSNMTDTGNHGYLYVCVQVWNGERLEKTVSVEDLKDSHSRINEDSMYKSGCGMRGGEWVGCEGRAMGGV